MTFIDIDTGWLQIDRENEPKVCMAMSSYRDALLFAFGYATALQHHAKRVQIRARTGNTVFTGSSHPELHVLFDSTQQEDLAYHYMPA